LKALQVLYFQLKEDWRIPCNSPKRGMRGDNNGNLDESGDVDLRDDTRVFVGTLDRLDEPARPLPDVTGHETKFHPHSVIATARDRDD
jgi:hypothetical protein